MQRAEAQEAGAGGYEAIASGRMSNASSPSVVGTMASVEEIILQEAFCQEKCYIEPVGNPQISAIAFVNRDI